MSSNNSRSSGRKPSAGKGRNPRQGSKQYRPAGKNSGAGKKPNPRPQRRQVPKQTVDVHDHDGVRLQKVMAEAGVGSRRACEKLISEGRVTVDGNIVTELGTRIDPVAQVVHVDSVRINTDTSKLYLMLHKPAGVVSSMHDEEGRPDLSKYVRNQEERIFHVGRLDQDSEGVLLLTNDGELANRLAHPSYEIPKTYLAQVKGPVARDVGVRLRAGIDLDDGFVKVDSFRMIDSTPGKALVEVVLHSGKNRVVRRLLAAVGNPVERLVRTDFGPIKLGDQKAGKIRPLRDDELGAIMKAVGL